jgi:hypothetical protein
MPVPQPQFWNSAQSAQITAVVTDEIAAGSAPVETTYWVYNGKGTAGLDTLQDCFFEVIAVEGSTEYVDGLSLLDEGWYEVQVTGTVDDTGDPGNVEAQSTAWLKVGANLHPTLSPIQSNCGRQIKVRWVVPAHAPNSVTAPELQLRYNVTANPDGWTDISASVLFDTDTGTITVDGADIIRARYRVVGGNEYVGDEVEVQITLDGITLASGPSNFLTIQIPDTEFILNGTTRALADARPFCAVVAGAAVAPGVLLGYYDSTAEQSWLELYRPGTTWADGTNTTDIHIHTRLPLAA